MTEYKNVREMGDGRLVPTQEAEPGFALLEEKARASMDGAIGKAMRIRQFLFGTPPEDEPYNRPECFNDALKLLAYRSDNLYSLLNEIATRLGVGE
jgi:hypothetical protein